MSSGFCYHIQNVFKQPLRCINGSASSFITEKSLKLNYLLLLKMTMSLSPITDNVLFRFDAVVDALVVFLKIGTNGHGLVLNELRLSL